ncbi:hypothetical protein AKJ09_02181 [Labilithrix luteola]|uniref:Putative zinc-finger domain-containing protein n=1 Tax=Labilithrix luteola TaxID=1391654 RepID=A0A0K1PPS1_9BACT|nr:zf-HC2 domain-containing protein [Labilithrix luteola]AKU95517.1 hypothetical protein AKJ09_02181 [Labilithrix luteola]
MSNNPKAAATLRRLLATTRDEELDCDRFFALMAPYLDGQLGDEQLREQIAHHAQQCPECSEELEILKRALAPDEE